MKSAAGACRDTVAPPFLSLPVFLLAVAAGLLLQATAAKECALEVTEEDMRPLLGPSASPRWRCQELWSNLLLHFYYTHKNLTACESHEEQLTTPEPSFTFCQLMLDEVRDDLEEDRRLFQRERHTRVQVAEMEIRKQQNARAQMEGELRKVRDEMKPLTFELLLTNIGMGNVRQALKYYHLYLQGHPPDTVYRAIIEWIYRDARHENQRLDNLLKFVRHLVGKPAKLTLYRLIKPEILKRPGQRDGYLAAVAGLDAGRVIFDDNNEQEYHLYTELFEPVERHWKKQMLAGKYGEVIAFATSHPLHYGEVETTFSTFPTEDWKKLDLKRLITFPNQLPLARQRLEALLMILLQLQERNKNNFQDYLLALAKEVEIAEGLVKRSKDSNTVQEKLAEVKRKFLEIDGSNDYEYYLQQAKKPPAKSG